MTRSGLPFPLESWTLGRFGDEIGRAYSDRMALVAADRTRGDDALQRWTYGEMARSVRALHWGLVEAGVQPGERVAVWLPNVADWVLHLFADTRLGAVFVPVNTRFRARELAHVLRHSGARTLVGLGRYLGHDYAAAVAEARREAPALRAVVSIRGEPPPGWMDGNVLARRGEALLATRGAPPYAGDPDVPALLFYTSGTTSAPKGVPLTHANVLAHSVRAGALLDLEPGEKVLSLYPFFGISGGANKVLSTLGWGAALVFQDAFRPEEACDLLAAEHCSVIHGVDVHVREMAAVQRSRGAGAQPERRGTIAFTGGIDAALAREMGDVLGLRRFSHPYGMTETNPMILRNALDDPFGACVRPGGRIAPGVEVRVVEPETGAERAVGEEGEIVVRGPSVMRGYYEDPKATAAAIRGGWFHTGDLGVRTGEGFVFYAGRLKDMLKVGGFNVAPQEIESLLLTHEAVEDAAVTGAADARLGEVPVAYVRLRPGALVTPDALIAWCRERLSNFKVPRALHRVDALPYHTAAHGAKLQRHVLREWAQAWPAAEPGGHERGGRHAALAKPGEREDDQHQVAPAEPGEREDDQHPVAPAEAGAQAKAHHPGFPRARE